MSEFPKERLEDVMIGMLVLMVAGYVGTIICHFASWVLPGFSESPCFGWHNCVIIPKKLFVVEPRVTALQCLLLWGCLGTSVDGLPCCGGSFNVAGARASSLDLCSINICYEQ